jgi:hypothetical protein
MGNLFPIPMQNAQSSTPSRALLNAAPIPVIAVPGMINTGGLQAVPALATVFSQQFVAVAVNASVTLIPALATLRWYIGLFRIFISATGIYNIQDGGIDIGFFQATLNTLQAPFGDLPQPVSAVNTNTALTLKNTSAAVCTYNVTMFGGYIA